MVRAWLDAGRGLRRSCRPLAAWLRAGVGAAAALVIVLMGLGCQVDGGPEREVAAPDEAREPAERPPGTSSYRHYRLNVEPVGVIPHAGLDLPVFSGDGRWVAWLEAEPEAGGLRDLVVRNAIEGVSVHVARVDGLERARQVAQDAAWPSFCPQSERLVAVSRDVEGNERFVVHELATGRTQVIAPGLRHMQRPRFSPDGSTLAFSAHAPDQVRSRIYTLQLETRLLAAAPVAPGEAWQEADHLAAHWLDDDALLLFVVGETGVELALWSRGDDEAAAWRVVGHVDLPRATAMGLHDALASVTQPLDPSRRYLAWYDAAADRMTVMDLAAGVVSPLDGGTHALTWMDDASLLAGDGRDVLLYELPRPRSPRQLVGGQLLPRWGSWRRGEALLLAPGQAGTFELLRLRMVRQR